MEQALTLLYILLSVSINSTVQIIWKKGTLGLPKKFNINEIIKMLLRPKIILGLLMYFVSALLWIIVLSNTELSYAFPFISIGYVLATILSYYILKEKINAKRIIGMSIIIIGVILVGLSL